MPAFRKPYSTPVENDAQNGIKTLLMRVQHL